MLSQEVKINDFRIVCRETLKRLVRDGYKWGAVDLLNKKRYMLVYGREGFPNIAIMFKREFFHNFGIQFRYLGYDGMGDSVNCEDLKCFIQKRVKYIYTGFQNSRVYKITPLKILKNSEKWINKEGKKVRSFSIHHYDFAFVLRK